MLKPIFLTASLFIFTSTLQVVQAQKQKQTNTDKSKKDLKFLDDIVVDAPASNSSTNSNFVKIQPSESLVSPVVTPLSYNNLEQANNLQFKYALLLDMEVEQIQNLMLFKVIDDWLGTHYKLGGSSKSGIDCSAFMQVLFTSIYNTTLPRTAREQYALCHKISRTELKEGDLVFFNTKRGISHVGMYLQNNKFVHASSSGVTVSDLYDDYWVRKFIAAGRIEKSSQLILESQP